MSLTIYEKVVKELKDTLISFDGKLSPDDMGGKIANVIFNYEMWEDDHDPDLIVKYPALDEILCLATDLEVPMSPKHAKMFYNQMVSKIRNLR